MGFWLFRVLERLGGCGEKGLFEYLVFVCFCVFLGIFGVFLRFFWDFFGYFLGCFGVFLGFFWDVWKCG